jgi:hypothetical protein
MEPHQLYMGAYIVILLISKFFQGDDHGDIESEEGDVLDERDILSSALGTMYQLED